MARPSPSCAHDDDRLHFSPASPPSSNSSEKKESTGPRLSQLCPPCATPSSSSSLDYRRSDAHIVENGFAERSVVSTSAKVVLDRTYQYRDLTDSYSTSIERGHDKRRRDGHHVTDICRRRAAASHARNACRMERSYAKSKVKRFGPIHDGPDALVDEVVIAAEIVSRGELSESALNSSNCGHRPK